MAAPETGAKRRIVSGDILRCDTRCPRFGKAGAEQRPGERCSRPYEHSLQEVAPRDRAILAELMAGP